MPRTTIQTEDKLDKRLLPRTDISGQQFGLWTVLRHAGKDCREHWFVCKCRCGREVCVRTRQLLGGLSSSCGCDGGTHRESRKTYEYGVWKAMRQRANDPNHIRASRYKGRGITVCERWNDYTLFLLDVGRAPTRRHTIDRIDNDKGYEPGNVKWSTYKEQARNKSNNVKITHEGVTMCMSAWAEKLGISTGRIEYRVKRYGVTVKDVLFGENGVS